MTLRQGSERLHQRSTGEHQRTKETRAYYETLKDMIIQEVSHRLWLPHRVSYEYIRNTVKDSEGHQGAFNNLNVIRTVDEAKPYFMWWKTYLLVDSTMSGCGYTQIAWGHLKAEELEDIRWYEEWMGFPEEEKGGRLYYFVEAIDFVILFEKLSWQSKE